MIIDLILTTNCNLRCNYCFENSKKNENNFFDIDLGENKYLIKNDFKLENAIFIIDSIMSIYPQDNIQINFLGGEPLLKFNLIKNIVKYCSDNYSDKVNYSITTNATLFNEEILGFMLYYKFNVKFSIDGCFKSNDINRKDIFGENSSIMIRKNLKYIKSFMKRSKSLSQIKYIVCNNNVNMFYESMSFLSTFNIPISFEINYEEKWNQEGINIFIYELNKYLQRYKELKKDGAVCIEIESIIYSLAKNEKYKYCLAGEELFTFLPNGDYYPCARFISIDKFKIGNIFKDGFKLPINSIYLSTESCNTVCCIKNSCNNECKFINYLYTKDFNKTSKFNCTIQKLLNNSVIMRINDIV